MSVKMTILSDPNPNPKTLTLSLSLSLTRSRPVRAANYGRWRSGVVDGDFSQTVSKVSNFCDKKTVKRRGRLYKGLMDHPQIE